MIWLIIVAFAYLLNAVATTIDRFLLTNKIPNPAVYTFYISVLSLVVLVAAPWQMTFDNWPQQLVAIVSGLFFAAAILYMFKAINKDEVSRISPFIGGLQPIFIFILAWFILQERLGGQSFIAFIIILLGTLIISWQPGTGRGSKRGRGGYVLAFIASLLFAVSYVLSKEVFNHMPFFSGLIWGRLGAFLGALLLLLSSRNRRDIVSQLSNKSESGSKGAHSNALLILGQLAGGLSAILVYYAISISSSVALVNATRGLEYVFLFVIILTLSRRNPGLLPEKMTPRILAQKAVATIFIVIGLYALFI